MITRSDISLLAVRIFALYLIAVGVSSLPVLSSLWRNELFTPSQRVAYSAAIVSTAVIGLAVLALSGVLARRLIPRTEAQAAPTARLSDIQSVVFATFGLLLIATTVPKALRTILMYVELRDDDYESWIGKPVALSQIASIAIGVLLCTGASYWTRLLAKFRNLGYEEQEGTKT